MSDVIVFDVNDEEYLRWISDNPHGWVVNATRTHKPTYLKLHAAKCDRISRPREPGAYTERDYVKVCSTHRGALVRWARREIGGTLDLRCRCMQ